MGEQSPTLDYIMSETDFKKQEKLTFKKPNLWKVVFLNDDRTPMDFVVDLLMSKFKHDEASAKIITMEIHNTGSGVAGVYPYEIAEHLGIESTNLSRANGFPLRITIEEET